MMAVLAILRLFSVVCRIRNPLLDLGILASDLGDTILPKKRGSRHGTGRSFASRFLVTR